MWTYNNELYHHGILGQKWGKRNGPPYPLDGESKSFAEKVGEKRLNKRIKTVEESATKLATKTGFHNALASTQTQEVSSYTKEILQDPKRVEKIGKGTIARRVGDVALTTAGIGAAFVAGTSQIAFPIICTPAFIAAGALYWEETTK